jgi:hypothetical protein
MHASNYSGATRECICSNMSGVSSLSANGQSLVTMGYGGTNPNWEHPSDSGRED